NQATPQPRAAAWRSSRRSTRTTPISRARSRPWTRGGRRLGRRDPHERGGGGAAVRGARPTVACTACREAARPIVQESFPSATSSQCRSGPRSIRACRPEARPRYIAPRERPMDRLKNPRLILALVLLVVAAVVFFQNQEKITLDMLFFGTITIAKATALLIAFATGGLCGALVFSRWQTKWQKERERKKGEKRKEGGKRAGAGS